MSYSVLSCGSNGSYQLGIAGNNLDTNVLQPIQLELSTEFEYLPIDIACGGNHSLILLENGNVYACGANVNELVDSKNDIVTPFRKINFESDDKIKHISAGWEFSVFVTIYDEIFLHGIGLNGELGLGNDIKKLDKMQRLPVDWKSLKGIKKIKSSIHSIIVQTGNDELWCWGNNKKGQLFDFKVEKHLKIVWEPTALAFKEDFKVVDWSMSRDFTVFLLKNVKTGIKEFELRGKDNFGIENKLSRFSEVTSIMPMWSSVHLVKEGSSLISIGNNSHGQLFPNNFKYDCFATGSEHGLCFSRKSNTVYAWGWGEHGNCGIQNGEKEHGDVTFDYLNVLYRVPPSKEFLKFYGGCATSWITLQNTKQ